MLGNGDGSIQSISIELEWCLAVVSTVPGNDFSETGLRRGTMNNDINDDRHPLDEDYSQAVDSTRSLIRMPEGKSLGAGVICFLVGLFSVIATAALIGVFRGVRLLETTGSYVHQVSMIMILVGGVLM